MEAAILLTVTGLSVGALYFLLASGLGLIFGLMNVLSFAHGAFLAVGAYVGWMILGNTDVVSGASTWEFMLAVFLAMVAGGVLAYLTEVFLIRPLYSRPHMDQLLVTMGLGFIIIAVISGIWGPDERSTILPEWLKTTTDIGGASVPNDRFILIAAAMLVFLGIELFLRRTRHGLIVRAGVENREMVRSLGIDVRKSFNLVFVLGGVAAGLAGALAAVHNRAVGPFIGDHLLLSAFIVLVVGGLGSMRGAIIAAVIVGLMQSFANFYINPGIGDILAVVLMAVVLLVRPQGLFGRKERLV